MRHLQAREVADDRAWAAELQKQAAAHRAQQLARRTASAAAVEELKVQTSAAIGLRMFWHALLSDCLAALSGEIPASGGMYDRSSDRRQTVG